MLLAVRGGLRSTSYTSLAAVAYWFPVLRRWERSLNNIVSTVHLLFCVVHAWSFLAIPIALRKEFPHLRVVVEGDSFEFAVDEEADDGRAEVVDEIDDAEHKTAADDSGRTQVASVLNPR